MLRKTYIEKITHYLDIFPTVALLGPRQVGKTTLSRQIAEHLPKNQVHVFDLEDPTDLGRLENPKLALESLEGLIIIDEIQKRPDLFPYLRVLIDQQKAQKFLVLGSASRDLLQQSSETLAGRIAYIECYPFSFLEVKDMKKLWIRGGYPKSYLASSGDVSWLWRKHYVQTFLEQDIPQLGFDLSPQQMRRFWTMLAHYHGQIINYSELGRSLQISDQTVRRYLDILTDTFMVRPLSPWYENLGKRLVKQPKIYLRDSGLFHYLMGIETFHQLQSNPKLGASWEGLALGQIIEKLNADAQDCYFYATHQGAECDLLIVKDGKKIGFEIKYSDRPKLTKSMQVVIDDLKLDHLYAIYPINKTFRLAENITSMGLEEFLLT